MSLFKAINCLNGSVLLGRLGRFVTTHAITALIGNYLYKLRLECPRRTKVSLMVARVNLFAFLERKNTCA